mgnify:CR=1 FL=1
MSREKLGSRLGFILLSAGCAIGIGNVWKFPYVVGENGGGIFVLIYLLFLAILGIPVLTMEFSIGRAAQKSPVRMYQQLEPKGSKWHIHGKVAMAGGEESATSVSSKATFTDSPSRVLSLPM